MQILGGIFGVVWMIGFAGNILLFLYAEWLLIRESFWNLINPLLQLGAIIQLLTWPLFWIFVAITLIGYFGAQYFSQRA
ncbi:hypothetical protein [Meiothermus granaticius]|uniref:Uncharacterized protein n=1 Tax=Meiothermus granaticius NBRC 107808 TaxID=1227551 RepID=A0A399FF75_9DEIN|nr:hypothetical protein [Meiothermus granaticius]RIH93892.1 hypothetical protein Mgrana_00241 [Meiothermus granaticius NBRC 107808]GEM86388.1 hypothetical protein MGR01S_10130 [Meiothermus granaticius NBRC 107808]